MQYNLIIIINRIFFLFSINKISFTTTALLATAIFTSRDQAVFFNK